MACHWIEGYPACLAHHPMNIMNKESMVSRDMRWLPIVKQMHIQLVYNLMVLKWLVVVNNNSPIRLMVLDHFLSMVCTSEYGWLWIDQGITCRLV